MCASLHGKYQYQFSCVEAPHEFIIAMFFYPQAYSCIISTDEDPCL